MVIICKPRCFQEKQQARNCAHAPVRRRGEGEFGACASRHLFRSRALQVPEPPGRAALLVNEQVTEKGSRPRGNRKKLRREKRTSFLSKPTAIQNLCHSFLSAIVFDGQHLQLWEGTGVEKSTSLNKNNLLTNTPCHPGCFTRSGVLWFWCTHRPEPPQFSFSLIMYHIWASKEVLQAPATTYYPNSYAYMFITLRADRQQQRLVCLWALVLREQKRSFTGKYFFSVWASRTPRK